MNKSLYVTATGTDVGKTYITALITKKMKESGYDIGYYKPALSGAESIAQSDAGYVNKYAGLGEDENLLISYLYKNAYSPHLAARVEGNIVSMARIYKDYLAVSDRYEYTIIEGSGGIVCPIRWDDKEKILLEDIILKLCPNVIMVADAGLGTINSTMLTAEYLERRNIGIGGIILNRYDDSLMHRDNVEMISQLTKLPILALVSDNDDEIEIDADKLAQLFK